MRALGMTGVSGAVALLDAYLAAPPGTEVEIRIGSPEGVPEVRVVVVQMSDLTVGLTAHQARALADAIVSGIRVFPADEENAGFADLVMALRAGADQADRESAS